jgi:hypothetical protein
MGKFVLKNCRLFAGGADITSNSNKLGVMCEVEDKPATNFGSAGWTEMLAGLFSTKIDGAGQWEATDLSKVDDAMWADLTGGAAVPWTACPTSAEVGELAWVVKAIDTNYEFGGSVGDVAPWTASGAGTAPTCRGEILHPPGTARTATGSGTARQLGALSATQALFVNLHVLSVSGTSTPTLTVTVQSDDASGFPSSTTRGTFTAATAIGGQSMRISGAVTDDYWRVGWTISGTNPSFLFVVSAGIGAL